MGGSEYEPLAEQVVSNVLLGPDRDGNIIGKCKSLNLCHVPDNNKAAEDHLQK